MILSVCPNPSIDCTVELDALNVGQLNRIENKLTTYSGKAMNAGIGVRRLGADSFVTGFMFERDGKMFVHNLEKEGIANKFVWNDGSVRVNYKIIDNRSMLTELNDKGEMVAIDKQKELLDLVGELSKQAAVCIMSGSLPQGVDADYFARMIDVVPKGTKIIVDTEGEKLVYAASRGVYLVKPNLFELETIVKHKLDNFEDMLKACQHLIGLGAENVLLSLGRSGAILTNGAHSLYCKSANVAVNSTVGAGDSMIAAAAYETERNSPYDVILRSAVAAGTASITTSGTNLFYRDKFEEIYAKINVQTLA